jgi:elongation factor G
MLEDIPTTDQFMQAICCATVSHKFTPVLMGSAFKNATAQPLLNAGIAEPIYKFTLNV